MSRADLVYPVAVGLAEGGWVTVLYLLVDAVARVDPGLGPLVFMVVAGGTCLLAGRLDRLTASRLTIIVGLLAGGAVAGMVLSGGALAAIAGSRPGRGGDGRSRRGPRRSRRPARVHPGRLDPRSRRGGPAVLPGPGGAVRGMDLWRRPRRTAPLDLPRDGRPADPGLPGRRPGRDRARPLGAGRLGRRVRPTDEPDLAGGPRRRRDGRRIAGLPIGSGLERSWPRSSPGRCPCRSSSWVQSWPDWSSPRGEVRSCDTGARALWPFAPARHPAPCLPQSCPAPGRAQGAAVGRRRTGADRADHARLRPRPGLARPSRS